MSKKNKNGIRIECLLQNLAFEGKTGIKLPLREKEGKKEIAYLLELKNKKLISEKACDCKVKEIESRTLSDKLYKEFYECLAI